MYGDVTVIREEVPGAHTVILDVRQHENRKAAEDYAEKKARTLGENTFISVEILFDWRK